MQDLPVFQMAFFLATTKRRSYHEHVRKVAEILQEFLRSHELLKNPARFSTVPVPDNFAIMQSDLTIEGLAWLGEGSLDRWLNAHDRGTPIEKTTILERGLAKVRQFRGK